MHVRPVDMPILRHEAIAAVEARGVRAYRAAMDMFAAESFSGDPDALARRLAVGQVEVLRRAELFFVEENMMRLAEEAAKTLDATDLYEQDLPAERGFVLFEKEIGFDDRDDAVESERFVVCAASWTLMRVGDERALHILWFDSGDEVRRRARSEGWEPGHPVERINQHLFTLWRLGAGATITINGQPTLLNETPEGRAVGVLASVWHIMRQTLAEVSAAKYDRATIRRMRREDRDPEPVRVIALRRRAVGQASVGSDREYHFQWIVRGHWRQQWYPSMELHRPVWIAPHIKGPEDAPLLGGEKVYALKR